MGEAAEHIVRTAAQALSHARGMLGVIEDTELRLGRSLVPVGAVSPFVVPAADWLAAVISLAGDGKARIILVDAKRPGNGALSRLVANIERAGLVPVICEPVGQSMPAIVAHWNWKRHVRGYGFERVEEWQPRRPALSSQEEDG